MPRLFLRLCLLAIFVTACSTPATPIASTQVIPSPEPTVMPSPAPASQFIILAYATDGIIADIIPYDKLTHINYSFLTPKADGSFNPINNGWKLKQIVEAARAHGVRVNISVGGWGWDAQFEELAADRASRSAFVRNLRIF